MRYLYRRQKRLSFAIEGIEPRSKQSMREQDKDLVQKQLIEHLDRRRRSAFRGPLALSVHLTTTDKNPTHSHNIAKNLLDLFGKPRPAIKTGRKGLLYYDDQQVHALSVICHHGEEEPGARVTAIPLGGLMEDIALAKRLEDEREEGHLWEDRSGIEEALEAMEELKQQEGPFREQFGDEAFEAMLNIYTQQVQENWLGHVALSITDLARIYEVRGASVVSQFWVKFLGSTHMRIQLSELPQVSSAKDRWMKEIDQKLREFQAETGFLDPLLVPVALEVLIKPPPPSRQNGLHDLDNVLRSYLIPRVVEILKPVSHPAFAFERLGTEVLESIAGLGAVSHRKPPVATRSGVTRYEVWRLPPADENSLGFVSVAIVSDFTGKGDVLRKVDDEIERWHGSYWPRDD